MPKIWVIAPFEYELPDVWQHVWQFNLEEGFISIGWRDLKNVSALSESQIFERHRRTWPGNKERGAIGDAKVLHKFWHEIAIGDKVVARRGRKSIAAIGTVKSKPYYAPNKAKNSFKPWPAYPNHIDIDWDDESRDVMFPKQVFGMQTIHSISPVGLSSLLALHTGHSGIPYPDEVENDELFDGAQKKVVVNAYERDPKARAVCLKHHGYQCAVCEMLFTEVYGEIGINFIHVHHLKPLGERKKRQRVNPVKNLVPACPNCHAMLHTSKPPLTISKLRSVLAKQAER